MIRDPQLGDVGLEQRFSKRRPDRSQTLKSNPQAAQTRSVDVVGHSLAERQKEPMSRWSSGGAQRPLRTTDDVLRESFPKHVRVARFKPHVRSRKRPAAVDTPSQEPHRFGIVSSDWGRGDANLAAAEGDLCCSVFEAHTARQIEPVDENVFEGLLELVSSYPAGTNRMLPISDPEHVAVHVRDYENRAGRVKPEVDPLMTALAHQSHKVLV